VFRKLPNGKYGLWDWYGGPPAKGRRVKKMQSDGNTDSDDIVVEEDEGSGSDDGVMPNFTPGAR